MDSQFYAMNTSEGQTGEKIVSHGNIAPQLDIGIVPSQMISPAGNVPLEAARGSDSISDSLERYFFSSL